MANRVPPQNIEAEQSIMGGLLLDQEAFDQVADQISTEDFYSPQHQILFECIKALKTKNQPVDVITLTNLLQSEGKLSQAGGYEYLALLLEKTISASNIASYVKIVYEKSLLRRLIQTNADIIDRAYSPDSADVEVLLDQAEAEIFKVGDRKTQKSGLTNSMEIVKASIQKIEDLYARKGEVTGVSSGFRDLDKMTAGFHAGELSIIAARPSMGKTAFSLNLTQHMATRLKKTVAYFSLEMGKEAVMMRMLSSESAVQMSEIRNGRIQDSSWPKLIQAAGRLSESPLYIDDTSGISPFEIRARARRLKARYGLDMIMIDYLQLMQLKTRVESREREVSEISKSLKALAKELQVPVVALAQLNRSVEGRADRRPMLSDLRESGSIEQDADVIMMLYRDDYYDKEDPEKAGHAEVIVGKQRNGPTGVVHLKFEAKTNRFMDADEHSQGPLPPPPPQPTYGGKPRNFAPGASL
ncbi:MAG: replicative DNA helicase [Pseudobdellovibrionaceae bacterium]